MRKKFIAAMVIVAVMALGPVAAFANEPSPDLPFEDVQPHDWFYNAVAWAFDNGLMNGISETEFAPAGYMTRAMLVTLLWRYEGMPDAGEATFSDVAGNRWYSRAIAWAAENGIVMGYDETTFGVNDFITRQQMYTVLYRYMNFAGIVIAVEDEMRLQQFADADDISDWAKDALHFMFDIGVMFRYHDFDFYARPQENALRSEIAGAMYFFNMRRAEAEYSKPIDVGVNFTPRIIRTDIFSWSLESEFPNHPVIIRSMAELHAHMGFFSQHVLSWNADGQSTYMNNVVFGAYNEAFFESHILVILYFEESSGSNSHRVDAVFANGDIHVTRIVPEIGTADMAGWHILIEVDSSVVPEQFNLVVANEFV